MKAPSLLTGNFPLLGAKFSFLLAIPFVLGPASVPTHSTADAPFTFSNTGNLNTARDTHTATLLSSGMVLLAGGLDGSGRLPRARNSTTRRPGSGLPPAALTPHVFITLRPCSPTVWCWCAGGLDSSGHDSATAELYNPATGVWTPPAASTPHALPHRDLAAQRHGAGRRRIGRNNIALASAELYNPATGTWTATGSLNTARDTHTATLLPNGMVLVAGGVDSNFNDSASAELYDPATGTWTCHRQPQHRTRSSHTATLLPNGMVLVAGGSTAVAIPSASAELFNPATGELDVPPASSTPHALSHRDLAA